MSYNNFLYLRQGKRVKFFTRFVRNKKKCKKISIAMTYDNNFGNVRVGTVVIICPQSSVPSPKNKHHSHCSRVSSLVENAILPYWMMTTCKDRCSLKSRVFLILLSLRASKRTFSKEKFPFLGLEKWNCS